jgi:tRNA A-37 threonylcarbamoyl transferase component Bud32/tetratricopeptide (TPR) repeat protein
LLGEVVAGRFEIEALAGRGGMGAVYRARDRASGRIVALKTMRPEERHQTERFLREAVALSELHHPAIVRYIAHGEAGPEADGAAYLAMEWLEGEALSDRLRKEGVNVAETIALGLRMSEALAVAHRAGVVHRDIKPSNIFLPEGEVARAKVIDFGIARVDGGGELTRTGAMLGTPGYIAPEQARGERTIDGRADLFSLGCVLYKCLTGEPPFEGDDVLAVLLKVVLSDAPRARGRNPDVPEELDELVARLLAKDPDARPASAADVARTLGSLTTHGEGRARPVSAPPALTTTERRATCVVLARAPWLSTEEDVTLVTSASQAREIAVKQAVAKHAGSVAFLRDGSIVVTVPHAGPATDQAGRAARCALALRPLLGSGQASIPPMIAVAAARAMPSAGMALGELIDRGVGLLTPRGAGLIRLDDVTAGLLDERFDVGGDNVGLYLRGERDSITESRRLLGKTTPCVGRDRELASLEGTFAEAAGDMVARAVLVVAPAGTGKSRLRYEFLRRLAARDEPPRVWIGRGDPMSAGAPFAMLGQALRRLVGMLDGEPLAIRQQRLRARVGRNVAPRDLERVTMFLGELAGAPFSGDHVQLRAARADALLMGDQIRRALEDFVAAEAASEPVLLVLEDLHWGDLPTVHVVDVLLRNLHDRPFMVLATARPEVRQLFPSLWEGRALTELRLGDLSRRAAEKLVREVLGADLDARLVAQIVDRSAGNAFYLEELIRAVAAGHGDDLPGTVLAMVQARLESMRPEARRVLRAASVFGQVFWRGGVEALLGGARERERAGEELQTLGREELVSPRLEGRFPGDQELVFRHGLVRECAYATLTESDRALGHRLAAQWLERTGETEAIVLADHFERGGDLLRASAWFPRAAEQAVRAGDFNAARERARRGISCGARAGLWPALADAPPEDPFMTVDAPMDARLGELLRIVADAEAWLGDLHAASRAFAQAVHALAPRTAAWYLAVAGLAAMAGRLGDSGVLADVAMELLGGVPPEDARTAFVSAAARASSALVLSGHNELAASLLLRVAEHEGEVTDPGALAWVSRARSNQALIEGDPSGYLRHCAETARAFEAAGDLRNLSVQRVNAGYGLLELGLLDEAEVELRDALAGAMRLGLAGLEAGARHNLGLALLHQAEREKDLTRRIAYLDEATEIEERALEVLIASGDSRIEGGTRIILARLSLVRGAPKAAEEAIRACLASLARAPAPRSHALAVLARAQLAEGRNVDALLAAREAFGVLEASGGIDWGDAFVRLTYVNALNATGQHEEARAKAEQAAQRLEESAGRIDDPRARASFLALPDHEATFTAAGRFEIARPRSS